MRIPLLAALAAFFMSGLALAIGPCGDRAGILEQLARLHQEAVTGRGITRTGNAVELLISSKGSWTILLTDPNGRTCLADSGQDWQDIERKVEKPGKPS